MKTPDGKWWDKTWNPVAKGKPFSEITLHHDRLEQPLHWRKRRRVAVNLMGDSLHPKVPDAFIAQMYAIMTLSPQHTFMLLTKRPERAVGLWRNLAAWTDAVASAILEHVPRPIDYGSPMGEAVHDYYNSPDPFPFPNVWLGVSVEDQATADERIPHLLKCPAAMRFVSVEPMLGAVDLTHIPYHSVGALHRMDALAGYGGWGDYDRSKYKLAWVIVGSESGPGARPMDLDWVRPIRDQCVKAGVPLWFKQMIINGKRVNMPELDGKVWDQMPEVGVASRENAAALLQET